MTLPLVSIPHTSYPGVPVRLCDTAASHTSPLTPPPAPQVSPCASMTSAGRIYGDLFVPLLYVLFNVGDFIGRLVSGYGPWSYGAPPPLTILTYALLR